MDDDAYLEKVGESANTASFYVQNLPPTLRSEVLFHKLLEQWIDFIDVYAADSIRTHSENKEIQKACEEFHKALSHFRKFHLLSLMPSNKKEALLREVQEKPLFKHMRSRKPDVPSNDVFFRG